MKNLALFFSLIFFCSCALLEKPAELSLEDQQIADEQDVDALAIADFREIVGDKAEIYTKEMVTADDDIVVLCAELSENKTRLLVRKHQKDFTDDGYLLFVSEVNYGEGEDVLSLMKTNNQFDALDLVGTSGSEISTEEIIKTLKHWHVDHPFTITAVDFDLVDARFENMPSDLDAFAAEMIELAPDVLDSEGDMEGVIERIEYNRGFSLFWE